MRLPILIFANAGRWVARRILVAIDSRNKRIDDQTPWGDQ